MNDHEDFESLAIVLSFFCMIASINIRTKKVRTMKKIGLGLDYSNICKDYNTVYLDRDNDDPATMKCMRGVLAWFDEFLSEIIEEFGYKTYRLNHKPTVNLSEIVSKRFLFYSLEKEITLQTYILHHEDNTYNTLPQWASESTNSLLIKNDEEGEGIYFYMIENSKIHQWLLNKLNDYSLDEVPFQEK